MLNRLLATTSKRTSGGGSIAFNGDSITAGAGVLQPGLDWPIHATPLISGLFTWANRALSGQTVEDINAARILGSGYGYVDDLWLETGRIIPLSDARNVYVLFIGTNDLAIDGVTGAELIALMSTHITDSFAAGADRIVLVSMLDRVVGGGGQAAFDTARPIFNDWQAAQPTEDPRIFYADIQSDPLLADPTNSTYYSDGIHWTFTGAVYGAGLIAAVVNTAIAWSST